MTSNLMPVNYSDYVLENDFISEQNGTGTRGREFYIYKCKDGTEWVRLKNSEKAVERFCGFLYLQEAKLKEVIPAENKMAKYRGEIVYLSKYCGENFPNVFQSCEAVGELREKGYKDFQQGANMRIVDHKIYIFDTEKSSFDPKVHEKIDAFVAMHDAIRTNLESKRN